MGRVVGEGVLGCVDSSTEGCFIFCSGNYCTGFNLDTARGG